MRCDCALVFSCRTQVTSLSAELLVERKVSEEARIEVVAAISEASKYQSEVCNRLFPLLL